MSWDFRLLVFSWISFSQAPEFNIRVVANFFEISWRYSQLKVHHQCCWHRWQMEKFSIIKALIILFGHLWEVELTYRYIFAFKFTLRCQQPDIVPIICHWCCWHSIIATGINNTSETGGKIFCRFRWYRWQICCWCGCYTGGNFAAGVVDTGGAPWLANISANFWKNLKRS